MKIAYCDEGGDHTNKIIMKQRGSESPPIICISSTSTSTGSDIDFKTTTRLGRMITEDEEEDDSHRQLWTDDEEQQEQYKNQSNFQSIKALTQLASMDPVEYQYRLINNTLPSTHSNHADVIKLSESIHRLQSTTATLTKEYDQQTIEVVDLQKQVNESGARISMLEKAVTKLYNRNKRLKKKTKSEQSFVRNLVEQIRQFRDNASQRKEEEEFYRLADKVQQHEQSLKMRQRTDSNFSDLDSVQSGMSSQSLVTDDGIATVKIHRERTLTWPKLDDDEEDPSMTSDDHNEDKNPKQAVSPSPLESLPFAKFLAPRPPQPYTLALSPPCSLQFTLLPKNDTTSSPGNEVEAQSNTDAETAFCVCGFHGFDTAVNAKPTLGARLLAINKIPVNPSIRTIKDLDGALESLSQTRHLTFRNDRWDVKQKHLLDNAIQEQKRMHPQERGEGGAFLRRRAQSGESSNHQILGFLNFHKHKEELDQAQTPPSPSEGQDHNSLISDISSYWKNCKTPSSKGEVSFDEEMLATGLAMPDVVDLRTHNSTPEMEQNQQRQEKEAKEAVRQLIPNDSPKNGAFSLFRRGDNETTMEDDATIDALVPAGGATEDTMPETPTAPVVVSNNFESRVGDVKKPSPVEPDDRETPQQGSFVAFWKINQKAKNSKMDIDMDNASEQVEEKEESKMPILAERKSVSNLNTQESPMNNNESSFSNGVIKEDVESSMDIEELKKPPSSPKKTDQEITLPNAFASIRKGIDKNTKKDSCCTPTNEKQHVVVVDDDGGGHSFLAPRTRNTEGGEKTQTTMEKDSKDLKDNCAVGNGFASFWKQNTSFLCRDTIEEEASKYSSDKPNETEDHRRTPPILFQGVEEITSNNEVIETDKVGRKSKDDDLKTLNEPTFGKFFAFG